MSQVLFITLLNPVTAGFNHYLGFSNGVLLSGLVRALCNIYLCVLFFHFPMQVPSFLSFFFFHCIFLELPYLSFHLLCFHAFPLVPFVLLDISSHS